VRLPEGFAHGNLQKIALAGIRTMFIAFGAFLLWGEKWGVYSSCVMRKRLFFPRTTTASPNWV